MTVDNDLRKQQQMVPSLSATNSSANKLNGNSDTDRIDIRVVGSNGNETMNVKEGTQTVTEAREYHESDNHLRRRLLWISVDTETEDSLTKSTELVLNSTIESHIEDVMDENRQQSKIINFADSGKMLIRVKRDDNAEENSALQNNCNLQMSDANHHARYKRFTYSFENLESNNAAENVEAGKEVAVDHDEKEENNEEYENVERVKGDYNDSEEDVMEDNDRAMESERKGLISSRHRIDPVRAKIDMLIKQKLEKKNKNKDADYRRKKRSMLDMIEYYDYDDNNEEQERDAQINKQGIQDKNDEFLIEDERSEMKRAAEDKTTCKPSDLGKKKNENAEAMMKEEREKTKNKEPKEQIIVDLGERKNKTLKNDQKDKKPSGASESNLGDALSKRKQLSTEKNSGKIRQSEDFRNNVYREESADLKPKW
ncbi:stress response protein NST1-like [Formica exsecta]|uniref:stress response protein NST1-like n=1 Tax=Formica exsecta TaxID=72781 RepID=UPI0011412D9A|nr:stress response protein NST1-like [Formica exsecta]